MNSIKSWFKKTGDVLATKIANLNFDFGTGTLKLDSVTPSVTTNKLYNEGGNLKFDGSILGAANVANIVTVASSGADYTSIKTALDYVKTQSPTSSNRWVISIYPGVYTEAPMVIVPYIDIVPVSERFTTKIIASNITTALFTASGMGPISIKNLSVDGVTTNAAFLNATATCALSVVDCQIANCQIGIHCTAGIILTSNIGTVSGSTMTNMFKADAGTIQIRGANVLGSATFTEYAFVDNGGTLGMEGIVMNGANVSTFLRLDNGGFCKLFNSAIRQCTKGIVIDGGSNCGISSVVMESAVTTHAEVLDLASVLHYAGGGLDSDRFIFADGYNLDLIVFVDHKEADEGFKVYGELGVGRPEKGSESVFGEGDSYTRGMMVYTEDTLNAFVDVSTEAQSASASTFTFTGVAADNSIYISTDLQNGSDYLFFHGIKSACTIAAVVGGGEIVAEYWNGSWTEFTHMSVDSVGTYYPHAINIFERAQSEQVRFNSLILDDWVKNDPPTTGTDRFWVRFRIKTGITTAPTFQQFKLHTNRSELNQDGWLEYFGKARPVGQLGLTMALGKPFEGSMQSQTLYVSQDIGVGGDNNKFTATGDKMGASGFLPFDCDTSCPLKVIWAGHPNGNGTYGWTVRWGWLSEGDDLTYAEPGSPIANSDSVIVSKAATVDTAAIFEASLDISKMTSRRSGAYGDELWISIQPSTLPDNFTLGGSEITYTKWSEGGHI